MKVTAYTDASVLKKGEKFSAGWAVWLKSYKGRIVLSGKVPVPYNKDSTQSELYATLVAIVKCRDTWPQTTELMINTDCQAVIRILNLKKPTSYNPHLQKLYASTEKIIRTCDMRLDIRHVRSHTGRGDRRTYVNDRVDDLAWRRAAGLPLTGPTGAVRGSHEIKRRLFKQKKI